MGDPQCLLLGLTVTAFILVLGNTVVFVVFSSLGLNTGLVTNNLPTLRTDTQVLIYLTWAVVYLYQIIWGIHSLILVIKRRPGDLVFISPISLGLLILALALQLVVNTVFLIEVSFPFLVVISLVLLVSLGFNYGTLFNLRFSIAKQNLLMTDSLIRGLFQNGVDLYGTWAYISSLLNLSIILKTKTNPPLTASIADTIVLLFFITFNFTYIVSDLTVYDKYSRYTLTPYFLRLFVLGFLIPETQTTGVLIIEVLILAYTFGSLIGKFMIIFLTGKATPLVPIASDI